jgi:hypothetical protein
MQPPLFSVSFSKHAFPDGSDYSASKVLQNAHDEVKGMNSKDKDAYSSSIDSLLSIYPGDCDSLIKLYSSYISSNLGHLF